VHAHGKTHDACMVHYVELTGGKYRAAPGGRHGPTENTTVYGLGFGGNGAGHRRPNKKCPASATRPLP
jgi:hypothetical protein